MTAKEVGLNSQESIVLKSLVGTGVAVFSLFMFMNWQKTLSEAKIAEQAQQEQEQVATIENTTPSSTSLVRSEPVVENSTPTVSQNSVATTATSVTEPIVNTPAETRSENSIATESTGSLITSTVDTTPEIEAAITDPALVESLTQKLYQKVDQAWQQTPSFSDDLVYQVKVQENGEIAEYTPLNEAAVNYLSEVPIDELHNEQAASLSEKFAHFLVVLTPSGRLQVNPWMGKN